MRLSVLPAKLTEDELKARKAEGLNSTVFDVRLTEVTEHEKELFVEHPVVLKFTPREGKEWFSSLLVDEYDSTLTRFATTDTITVTLSMPACPTVYDGPSATVGDTVTVTA